MSTKEAFDTLKSALQEDSEFAWSWHCNIAMAYYDEARRSKENFKDGGTITLHEMANRAAARFMQNCFGIDTSKSPQYTTLGI